VVTLCCGAGFFGGFLHPDLAKTVFASPDVCLAGSGAPTGTATVSDSGFIINGRWRHASGARHATHLTANCLIKAGEHVVSNPDGKPLILPFVFDRKDVSILPAWKYTGMISTGSDAFEVTDLYVPSGRCFKISPDAAVIDSPLYRYPFMQLAETTLAVNLSGMAVHFADLCGPLFEQKIVQKKLSVRQTDYLNNTLNQTLELLEQARHSFFESADRSWDALTGQSAGAFQTLLKSVSWASHSLAKRALKAVDELYPYCGLEAAQQDTDINRVWRDIHTASQHALLTFPAE
jgi:alkylation response protein AidB-like acyl-CoA dehydrogenase